MPARFALELLAQDALATRLAEQRAVRAQVKASRSRPPPCLGLGAGRLERRLDWGLVVTARGAKDAHG
jgi:hypothetical protein